jgi:uncharacterized protein YecE (DUF72 family)
MDTRGDGRVPILSLTLIGTMPSLDQRLEARAAGIRIGTSGWSYPSGQGTWNGIFYPTPRPRGFDELAFYAEHFDTVEVNSTFYRSPEAAHVARWVARTPSDFLFSVKLFQKFTHPDMYLARGGSADWNPSRVDLDLFRAGLEPLVAHGRLGALVMQFPPSFHYAPESLDYLHWLLDAFAGYRPAVELRHKSWSDQAGAVDAALAAHQAAWVLIDEPKFASSIAQTVSAPPTASPASSPLVYLRLHGRNAKDWWTHETAEDRYNYCYSPEELAPFADRAKAEASAGRKVFLYLNNHFSAKAAANAAVLQRQVGQPVRGDYGLAFRMAYPEAFPEA